MASAEYYHYITKFTKRPCTCRRAPALSLSFISLSSAGQVSQEGTEPQHTRTEHRQIGPLQIITIRQCSTGCQS